MRNSVTDSAPTSGLPSSSLAHIAKRPPVSCAPNQPVRNALQTMRSLGIGSMIVVDAGDVPRGILTLRDVLDRVVLDAGALDSPIERYMTPNPVTLRSTESAYAAALVMIRHGVRHVVLVESERLAGVVSERDLFGLQSTGVRHLSTAIKGAEDLAAVEAFGRDVTDLTRQMLAQGAATGPLTAFISSLIDLLTERIVELELRAAGADPSALCWIVMGSEGRSEQTLATDQDNGLIFAPVAGEDVNATRSRLVAIAKRINRALDRAGYKLCPGDIMGGNPQWCLTPDEWRERFARWIDSGSPEALLHGSIFFDLRPLAGNLQLGEALRTWLLARTPGNRRFLHQLASNALRNRPPLGFFGRFSTASDGHIDLKLNGAMPFVDAARIFALAGGIDEIRTESRLRAAGLHFGIAARETEAWIAAFYYLQGQRLKRQARCIDTDKAPDNKLDPAALHDYDRECLRAAFEQARNIQTRLALDFGAGG